MRCAALLEVRKPTKEQAGLKVRCVKASEHGIPHLNGTHTWM